MKRSLKFITLLLMIISTEASWSSDIICNKLMETFFHSKGKKTRDVQGLKLLPMDDILKHATPIKEALELRREYFNLDAPWKRFHDLFPHEPGKIYYRVMTLDRESLEHILKHGIEPEKASSWDGHYVATGVRLNYGVAASNFRGNITKVDDDHPILNIVFQFDAQKMPWPSTDRPKVAGRLYETIPVEAITNMWTYDLLRDDLFHIGSRAIEE